MSGRLVLRGAAWRAGSPLELLRLGGLVARQENRLRARSEQLSSSGTDLDGHNRRHSEGERVSAKSIAAAVAMNETFAQFASSLQRKESG